MEQYVILPEDHEVLPDGRIVPVIKTGPTIDPEGMAFLEAYDEAGRRQFEKETGLKADRPKKRKKKRS